MSAPRAVAEHNRAVVFHVYRNLLRATSLAFRGDKETLVASRKFARESFNLNKGKASGTIEAEQGIEHAKGVTQILRENVVQGAKGADGRYKLNIHEHTERGDNESIRKSEKEDSETVKHLKGTTKSFASMKS